MMLKPSIDRLLEQVDSKYSLVILSSKRAHELHDGAKPTVEKFESVKGVGQALEEIEHGKVEIDPNPELKRELKKRQADEVSIQREIAQKELEEKVINNKI